MIVEQTNRPLPGFNAYPGLVNQRRLGRVRRGGLNCLDRLGVRDSTPMGRIGFAYDGFERFPLCFHADVRVMLKHLFRDVPGYVPDRLVPSAAFREIRNERVAIVMPAACHLCRFTDVAPGSL